MSLRAHISTDALIQQARDKKSAHHLMGKEDVETMSGSYAGRYETERLPKYKMPSKGIEAEAAYRIVHDQTTDLDGQPNLNLASFVGTYMDTHATKLMHENIAKNLIDESEYSGSTVLHHRLVSMCAGLWHAHHSDKAIGTACVGSSEGILLACLAMKRRWQNRRKAAGKSIHEPGPNIIMGANAQVCLEKAAVYFDVENRMIDVTEGSRYCLDPKEAIKKCDENTIGVFVILGSTYTGVYENVQEMSDLLDDYEKETGNYIPIHVDAASGGFVAPFATPQLKWDFRIPRVVSIQASVHKFGRSYVGCGMVVWRNKEQLPSDLVFHLSYLGSEELSFSLNFSRPSAQVTAAYYSFIRHGFEGYRRMSLSELRNARVLSRALERSGYFKVLSEIHHVIEGRQDDGDVESYKSGLPVVAFAFSDEFKQKSPQVEQKWIQTLLRVKGWIVPNYALPPAAGDLEVLRVVVRESASEDLLEALITDLMAIMEDLSKRDSSSHHLAALGHHARTSATHPGGGARKAGETSAGEGMEGRKATGFASAC